VGFQKCYSDHSLSIRRISSGTVILIVYVDGIILTGSDDGIEKAKEYLKTQFVIKRNTGRPRHFLRIEIAHIKHVGLFQRKYGLNLLHEIGQLGHKAVCTPMDIDADLWNENEPLLEDVSHCRRLTSKLIYLTVTRQILSMLLDW